MDVIHHALWVSDIDRTLEFYVDGLGLERTREFESGDGATNVFVAGEGETEIQFKYDPDGERALSEPDRFDHTAIAVDDTDAAVERLVEEAEATLERGPLDSDGANARVAFLTDPEGYGIELVEEFE
ncbi:VOC family protein [Halobium palmae]|uniref:VOC family protein n=1 Tax=Halobium palmae TaxID=1776492 RepID=A0ABD5RXE9_9EURY